MTAHCRPKYAYDNFDLAADELASIYARKGIGTAQHREAVEVLRNIFENSASSPLLPSQHPAGGEGEAPSRSQSREGDGIMRR